LNPPGIFSTVHGGGKRLIEAQSDAPIHADYCLHDRVSKRPLVREYCHGLWKFEHYDFELEVVVIGENFATTKRTIKFRFDGKSPILLPLL
jgi:hypothetical protein